MRGRSGRDGAAGSVRFWTTKNLMRSPEQQRTHRPHRSTTLGILATFAADENRRQVGPATDASLTIGAVTWQPDPNTRTGGVDVVGPGGAVRFFLSGHVFTETSGWVFTSHSPPSAATGDFVCVERK